jgi:[acyl-carrier-protein] S-malonyltransferase
MAPAADKVAAALEDITIGTMKAPVVANVTGEPNQDPGLVKDLLVRQVTGTVRWQQSVEWMAGQGVESALELGHGSVIKGLVRRIAKEMSVSGVGSPDEVASVEL